MRIMHIANDEKFIDSAISIFDKSGSENFLIINQGLRSEKLSHVKTKCAPIPRNKLRKYLLDKDVWVGVDCVILHSLVNLSIVIPDNVPCVWIGFGYDYYDLINKELYLPKTRDYIRNKKRSIFDIKSFTLKLYEFIFIKNMDKKKFISKYVDYFSPVISTEYKMIEIKCMPEFLEWNYGTVETLIAKGIEEDVLLTNDVLVGNSATDTGNHLDVLELLSVDAVGGNVILPLNYGDESYASKVIIEFRKEFGSKVQAITNFMPLEEYLSLVSRCGIMIMLHKRQQAYANINLGLYTGAKIYLHSSSPLYDYLIGMGYIIFNENDINESSLSAALSRNEKINNRKILHSILSENVMIEKTKAMLNKITGKGN